MASLERKIAATPEPGEKLITSADLREFLEELKAAGDDGTVILYAKTDMTGRVKRLSATATTVARANWSDPPPDTWPFGSNADTAALDAPVTESRDGDGTLEGLTVAQALPAGPRHRIRQGEGG